MAGYVGYFIFQPPGRQPGSRPGVPFHPWPSADNLNGGRRVWREKQGKPALNPLRANMRAGGIYGLRLI